MLLHFTQPTSRQFEQFRRNAEVKAQRLSEALRQARHEKTTAAASRADTSRARDATDHAAYPPLHDIGMWTICLYAVGLGCPMNQILATCSNYQALCQQGFSIEIVSIIHNPQQQQQQCQN